MEGCGRKDQLAHGAFVVCGREAYGSPWFCDQCKLEGLNDLCGELYAALYMVCERLPLNDWLSDEEVIMATNALAKARGEN